MFSTKVSPILNRIWLNPKNEDKIFHMLKSLASDASCLTAQPNRGTEDFVSTAKDSRTVFGN